MKIECLNGPLCEAENDARILTLTLEAAFASHEIRLALLTPAGRRYLTPAITLTNGTGEYPLPACALDSRGKLMAQIIAQNGAGQVAKSEVFAFPVARSIPCETAQTAESGLITLGSLDTALNALSSAFDSLSPVAGSGSYTDLTDCPEIPTVPETLSSFTNDAGYLTAADVDGSLVASSENPVQSKVVQSALSGKQATYAADSSAWDSAPSTGSTKPVTSGGIKSALDGKQAVYDVNSLVWDHTPMKNGIFPMASGAIYNALHYKNNDTFTLQDVPINGHLTAAGKKIFLCVQVPKSLADITSITFDAFKGGLRTADGTDHYVESSSDSTDWTAAAGITLTATKKGEYVIQIKMEKSTVFSGAVNNNLVGLFCSPVTMKFHTS